MNKWTVFDIIKTTIFNAAVILITHFCLPLVTHNTDIGIKLAFFLYSAMPFIFSIPFTYYIKSKNKRLWIAETILSFIVAALLLFIWKQPFRPSNIDPETFGFTLLFILIHSAGLLLGSATGYLMWKIKNK